MNFKSRRLNVWIWNKSRKNKKIKYLPQGRENTENLSVFLRRKFFVTHTTFSHFLTFNIAFVIILSQYIALLPDSIFISAFEAVLQFFFIITLVLLLWKPENILRKYYFSGRENVHENTFIHIIFHIFYIRFRQSLVLNHSSAF
jgi:hypothetical protein